jgi:hypothetical protein
MEAHDGGEVLVCTTSGPEPSHHRPRLRLDLELLVDGPLFLDDNPAGREPLELLERRWHLGAVLVGAQGSHAVHEGVHLPQLPERRVQVPDPVVGAVLKVAGVTKNEHGDRGRIRGSDSARRLRLLW